MEHSISNEHLTLTVDTLGAQMLSIRTTDGCEYLWQGDSQYWRNRAPNLFPFIGRLTNNQCKVNGVSYPMAIHGFASACEFICTEQHAHKLVFTLTANQKTKEQYPFDFSFSVAYALEENTISITYIVENRDGITMPFAVGGHPGFRVPLVCEDAFTDYYLEFDQACNPERVGFTSQVYLNGVDTPYPVADRQIPLCHELFDEDAIILQNMARQVSLRSRKSSRGVCVSYPDMPYVGFWHCPKTDAPYVCIEPWSSLPSRQDVVEELTCKSDLIHLAARKTYENTWTITIF